MAEKRVLVITSIASDEHPILKLLAAKCSEINMEFILIGDTKSPSAFKLNGCSFWNVEEQQALPFELSKITPVKHYSRKNIGYLLAIQKGATQILETDDDNIPYEEFWGERKTIPQGFLIDSEGWVNIYQHFTGQFIWPRGLPLEYINTPGKGIDKTEKIIKYCPIQQGLADENPDVDAVFRLTRSLPVSFEKKGNYFLGKNTWCPFNSQNTFWLKESFPLLYLPSYCSFRMTDIWRSFVTQRIAWECGWNILFHHPTVMQERNDHSLLKDFEDEIPGYLNNHKICTELQQLSLLPGTENITGNLITCYNRLIEIGVIGKEETNLLNAWVADCEQLLK